MSSTVTVPRLENGDHLSRDEFERRYQHSPNIRAELIEGVVYVDSPVRARRHGLPRAHIITWLNVYASKHPETMALDNATVRLDLDNEPQPDALLRFVDGQSTVSEDDYVTGAPELVVEIAASSAAYDLFEKKTAYRRNGVQEYIVWRVDDAQVDWFYLHQGQYKTLNPNERGLLCSVIFAGLCLDIEALLAGELARVLDNIS
ncbi:MAG: Uma2 family endonuclease [Deinococcota bacterium]